VKNETKVTNLVTNASEGLRLQLDLRGATAQELLDLAEWLDARHWDEEADMVRAGVTSA
jgi:hypothetical protein